MPRKPKAAAQQPTAPAIPIVVDKTKFTIGDMLLFAKLGSLAGNSDPAATNAAMLEILPVLDRLVVGGVLHHPVALMPQVMQEVSRQLNEASDPNS